MPAKVEVVRLRHDPVALLKQLGITLAGLVVVTAGLLFLLYAQGDAFSAPLGEAHVEAAPHEPPAPLAPGPDLPAVGGEPTQQAEIGI